MGAGPGREDCFRAAELLEVSWKKGLQNCREELGLAPATPDFDVQGLLRASNQEHWAYLFTSFE